MNDYQSSQERLLHGITVAGGIERSVPSIAAIFYPIVLPHLSSKPLIHPPVFSGCTRDI
jgi:hypothetical protein